ncbi:hypothetical protein SAMN04487870_0750 [Pseudoalteromonas sp. DSM 26666]|uniref:hypothetical protein n=1 Tax=Pseudoalteromonas sp. DSM 26666 TaxID=1761892 RepID=UPI0008E6A894|nr:hypothetical protein [Pseudoalteromonas sp. DSM 26666]SFT50538.1 hypothetical protein SAMN04487870_0750 [Pseudoalteromonas sp. DSM 26666]
MKSSKPAFKPSIAFSPELKPVSISSIKETTKYLRKHYQKIEQIFSTEFDELCEEARDEDELMDGEANQFGEYNGSDLWMVAKEIDFIHIRMHRYSTVLSLYAVLDKTLKIFCRGIDDRHKGKIRLKDLKGTGIQLYFNYLTKVCDFSFDPVNDSWSSIQTLRRIRNSIMHSTGDVDLDDDGKDNFIKHIEREKHVYFIEKHLLMVKEEYIFQAIDDVEKFLTYILDYSNKKLQF